MQRQALLQLLLCVLLADAVAGQLWVVLVSSSASGDGIFDKSNASGWSLPYAQPESVAARLSKWLSQPLGDFVSGTSSAFSHLMAAISGMAILGLALGRLGLVMSAGWLMLAVAARLLVASKNAQSLLLAVYEVALPWLLGYLAYRRGQVSGLTMVPGIALLLLHLALHSNEASLGRRWAVRFAQVGLLACPIIARHSISSVIVAAALLVPVALQVRSGWTEPKPSWSSYRNVTQFWWWLATAAAVWAVGSVSAMVVTAA